MGQEGGAKKAPFGDDESVCNPQGVRSRKMMVAYATSAGKNKSMSLQVFIMHTARALTE